MKEVQAERAIELTPSTAADSDPNTAKGFLFVLFPFALLVITPEVSTCLDRGSLLGAGGPLSS